MLGPRANEHEKPGRDRGTDKEGNATTIDKGLFHRESITEKSYRSGKTFKDSSKFSVKSVKNETNDDSTTQKYASSTSIYAQTPTIKITILPQDDDVRSDSGRTLHRYGSLNRTRNRVSVTPSTTTETLNSTDSSTKPSLSALDRLRNRVTTTTPSAVETEDSEYGKLEDQDSTTKRSYGALSRTRSRFTTTKTTILDEVDEVSSTTEPSTRRAYTSQNPTLSALNRLRNRVKTSSTATTSAEGIDDSNSETTDSSSSTETSTKRAYIGINRFGTRTTTASSNKIDSDVDEASIRRKIKPLDRSSNHTSSAEVPPIQNTVNRLRNRPSSGENSVEISTNKYESTRRGYVNLNRQRTTTPANVEETTSTGESDVSGETTGQNIIDTTTNLPELTATEIGVKVETTLPTDTSDELVAEIDDKEISESTTTTSTENATDELTADIDDSTEITTGVEANGVANRTVLIRKRLRVTTQSSNEHVQNESTTESTSSPKPSRQIIIRKRLNTTTSNPSGESLVSTTTRNIVALSRQRYRTTLGTTANSEDTEEEATDNPINQVIGQSNRHRSLAFETSENLTEESNEKRVGTGSSIKVGTPSSLIRSNRFRTTPRVSKEDEHHDNKTAAEETDLDNNSTTPTSSTRRTFSRLNRLQTTSEATPNDESSKNTSEEISPENSTRSSFVRPSHIRTTNRTTINNVDATEKLTETAGTERTTTNERKRLFSKITRFQSTTPTSVQENVEKKSSTARGGFRPNRIGSTTPDSAQESESEENITSAPISRKPFVSRPRLPVPKTTSTRKNPPTFNRAVYNRVENGDETEDQDSSYDDGENEYDAEEPDSIRRPATFSRTQQFSRNQRFRPNPPSRTSFGQNRFNNPQRNEYVSDESVEEYDDDNDSAGIRNSRPPTTERSNALQNLRNRVRLSQTRSEQEDTSAINSRLKDLLVNRSTTTLKPEITSDNETSQNNNSTEDSEDEIHKTNKQKSTLLNKPIASLLANRNNTNRSSTVANYLSSARTNLNLKTNQTQSTINDVSSKVVNRKQNVDSHKNDVIDIVDDDDDDENDNIEEDDSAVSSKDKGNEVNSKRRFQKFQFNRTRTTSATSTTETPNARKQTGIADQVNQLVGDEDNDEDTDEDGDSNDDKQTAVSSPATKPIRISVLRNRRPVVVDNVNSTTVLNQTTLVDNSVSNNATTIISATNETNTAKPTSKLDTPSILQTFNDTSQIQNETETETETETSTLSSDTTPTKRFRKVIRKLIRPTTTTTEPNTIIDNDDEAITTPTAVNGTVQTTVARRLNGTRFGLNRSINTNHTQVQSTTDDESEKASRKELGAIIRGKSRFNFNNSKTETEKPTPRTSNFNPANRVKFGTHSSSTTTPTTIDSEEEDNADDNEDESEEETDTEITKSTPSSNRLLASRKPFVPGRISSSTASPESDVTTRRSFGFTRTNDIDDDELVADVDDEEETTEAQNNFDLQKLRDKVKVEQSKSNRDGGVINTRLKKILVVRKNGTNATRTEISAADLGSDDQQDDPLQKIRNKVKLEQSKGEHGLGVVNARLKKLLEEKNSNVTTPYVVAKAEEGLNTKGNDSLDLQRIRDKVKVELARGDQDKGTVSSRLKKLLAERTNVTGESVDGSKVVDESSQNKTSVEADDESIVQPRPFTPRRPFLSNSRAKTSTEASSDSNVEDAESTTKAPLTRTGFRKKLVAKRPYSPQKTNVSTTVAPTVPTRPRRKFLKRVNGPGRFAPFNAGNRNTGEGFIRTDPRDSKLPDTTRFKSDGQAQVEENEDYDYDSEEDETQSDNEKSSSPGIPAVTARPNIARPPGFFNRPQSTVLKKPNELKKDDTTTAGDSEEDNEDDDEEDDEEEEGSSEDADTEDKKEENKPKSNSPSTYRPKDIRVPPGARPPLSPSGPGNVPYNPKNRLKLNQPNRFSPGSPNNRYAPSFGRSTTGRPRVINRPPGVAAPGLTIRPIAVDFERTTPAIPTKPAPFIPTNTRSYERKYVGPSTETPETTVDNSLIEDLNIEALNARNKKIFDINSKKHTTLKPKIIVPLGKSPTDQQADSQDTRQNTENESDDEYTVTNAAGEESGYATTTPRTLTNTENINNNDNVISSQDHGYYGSSTQQTPTTTLLHIFTLTDDEPTNRPPTGSGGKFMPRILAERVRPKHKVVEVNRIVEINSKEDKLRRKSKANQEFLKPIGTSTLKVESLPHIEQLGEISVVKYVHLVDGSDISIDGHSTVADYTPTEATIPRTSAPVRNSIPDEDLREYAQLSEGPRYVHIEKERNGKALIPEVIREAVETSTISLEGLFDNARKAKELNTIDGSTYYTYSYNAESTTVNPVLVIKQDTHIAADRESTIETTQQPTPATSPSTESATTVSSVADSFTVTPAEPKQEKLEATLPTTAVAPEDETSTTTATTTENPTKATTVAAALFPTYVRPIVPLLRPESNESSPLVISIANLDKVILSKVEKAQKALESKMETTQTSIIEQETHTDANELADSNSAFSSRHAAVVEAPTNLVVDLDSKKLQQNEGITKLVAVSTVGSTSSTDSVDSVNHTNTDLGTSINTSNSVGNNSKSSSISEIVSYRTETHVVRKKKSRSRKSKSRKLKNLSTTTVLPAAEIYSTSATATTTPLPIKTTLSVDEGYETTTVATAAETTLQQ